MTALVCGKLFVDVAPLSGIHADAKGIHILVANPTRPGGVGDILLPTQDYRSVSNAFSDLLCDMITGLALHLAGGGEADVAYTEQQDCTSLCIVFEPTSGLVQTVYEVEATKREGIGRLTEISKGFRLLPPEGKLYE